MSGKAASYPPRFRVRNIRNVAGALTNAVYRALDLARPGGDRGEAVCDRHPQVIMAVNAQHNLVDARDVFFEIPEELLELARHRVADSVRNVNGSCAGLDRRSDDFREIAAFSP
jgi:hypothetical protein